MTAQIKSAVTEATALQIVSLDCCDTTHPMTGMKETDVFAKRRTVIGNCLVVPQFYYTQITIIFLITFCKRKMKTCLFKTNTKEKLENYS